MEYSCIKLNGTDYPWCEGFWKNDHIYPEPIPHKESSKKLDQFIEKLKIIEESYVAESFDFECKCHICGSIIGECCIYDIIGNHEIESFRWPNSLMHYYVVHHIHPSDKFFDFVCHKFDFLNICRLKRKEIRRINLNQKKKITLERKRLRRAKFSYLSNTP